MERQCHQGSRARIGAFESESRNLNATAIPCLCRGNHGICQRQDQITLIIRMKDSVQGRMELTELLSVGCHQASGFAGSAVLIQDQNQWRIWPSRATIPKDIPGYESV